MWNSNNYDIFVVNTLVSSPHQWTPLHVAAEEGYIDVVKYLVVKQADIHVKAYNGVCTEWEYIMYLELDCSPDLHLSYHYSLLPNEEYV